MIRSDQLIKLRFVILIGRTQELSLLIRLIITFIIISYSLGLLIAAVKQRAAKALSSILFSPVRLYCILFFPRYIRNNATAIRLLPSIKEWFFIERYNSIAAFSSKDGYSSFLLNVYNIVPKVPLTA